MTAQPLKVRDAAVQPAFGNGDYVVFFQAVGSPAHGARLGFPSIDFPAGTPMFADSGVNALYSAAGVHAFSGSQMPVVGAGRGFAGLEAGEQFFSGRHGW